MEHLPREIVLDILSRLPVTTLLQFKLVCRAWNHLLQDPLLVSMHSARLAEKDPFLILHSDHPILNQLYSLELSAKNDDDQKVNKICVPVLPEFDVAGSCNGSLCLCDSSTKTSHFIYNPFTREYLELPRSVGYPNQEVVFGFGFHPTTKEYKVVKIVYYWIPNKLDGPFNPPQSEVQILTIGSPSWRSLGEIDYSLYKRPSQTLVNGRLHWTTWPERLRRKTFLISFDVADEQFRVVPKPGCGGRVRCYGAPFVLEGCLSAAVQGDHGQYEIWVMKDYDVKETWIKKFSLGNHVPRGLEQDVALSLMRSKFFRNRPLVQVLCLLKNGDILLDYRGRALVSYDPKTGNFEDLLIHEMPYLFESVIHEGSLNWINTFVDM